jgi:hypothetical protein
MTLYIVTHVMMTLSNTTLTIITHHYGLIVTLSKIFKL